MGNPKMLKAINQVVFNQYIEHIKGAGLYNVTLCGCRQGAPDPELQKTFILIKDLKKWCFMNRFEIIN
ncbi:MAG: hypothetical protein WC490_01940 [Candidatus Margulisiibacteriota bacterium]